MTARKDVTTAKDVSADIVAPDGTAAAAAVSPAPGDVSPASVAPVDPPAPADNPEAREAALTALLNGAPEATVVAAPIPADYNPDAKPVDFGGRVKCVVLFSRWNALSDGIFKSVRKGTVIGVSAKEAERGEALGGLRRIES